MSPFAVTISAVVLVVVASHAMHLDERADMDTISETEQLDELQNELQDDAYNTAHSHALLSALELQDQLQDDADNAANDHALLSARKGRRKKYKKLRELYKPCTDCKLKKKRIKELLAVMKQQKRTAKKMKMKKGKIVEAQGSRVNKMDKMEVMRHMSTEGPVWWIYHDPGGWGSRRKIIGIVSCPCTHSNGLTVSPEEARRRIIGQLATVPESHSLIKRPSKDAKYKMKLAFAGIKMMDCWTQHCLHKTEEEEPIDDLLDDENGAHTTAGWDCG